MAALRNRIDEVRFGFVIFNDAIGLIIQPGMRVMAASRSWFVRVTSEAPFAPQFVSLAPLQGFPDVLRFFFNQRKIRMPVPPVRIHFIRLFSTRYQTLPYIVPRYSRVRRIIKFCISRAAASRRAWHYCRRDFSARRNRNYARPRSRAAESS